MITSVGELINQLQHLSDRHGEDTEVRIFSYLGRDGSGIDEVRSHQIQNVDDGWYEKEKGDLINIECYRD